MPLRNYSHSGNKKRTQNVSEYMLVLALCLVNVLRDWYSKLFVRVRWGTAMSEVAMVSCGVRQGSVISPVLFNVFINVFL